VPGDREQVGAEAGVLAEPVLRGDAREHRALHEVIGVRAALRLEESAQRIEVPGEQRLSGVLVTGAPAVQEIEVVVHRVEDTAIG
jgi:hypothetical protein